MLTAKQLGKVTEKNLENLVRKAAEGKPLTAKEMAVLESATGKEIQPQATDQLTAEKFCQITNLSDIRHRQLAKGGYFPPPIKGIYQLTPALQGIIRYLRDQAAKADTTLEQEKLKKLTAERCLAELKLAKERKEALDAVAVFRAWENIILTIRQKILALPSKIAPRLVYLGEQVAIEEELARELSEALIDLAKIETYETQTDSPRPIQKRAKKAGKSAKAPAKN